jgi:hypothetical protein
MNQFFFWKPAQKRCVELLAEDSERERRRQSLKAQKSALEEASQTLDNLFKKYGKGDNNERINSGEDDNQNFLSPQNNLGDTQSDNMVFI